EFHVSGAGYAPTGDFTLRGIAVEPQLHPGLMYLLDTARKCSTARIAKSEEHWRAVGTPTEASLIVAAEKAGLRQKHHAAIVAENSFSSERKRMSVIEQAEDGFISHVKGAPEALLPLCSHYLADGARTEMPPAVRRE